MLEYLHHTQTISVKCRQTTRAVIIYIGCDRNLLFRFSLFSSGVQSSELHRKTDHLFGDVNRPAPPGSAGGWYTSLRIASKHCLSYGVFFFAARASEKKPHDRLYQASSPFVHYIMRLKYLQDKTPLFEVKTVLIWPVLLHPNRSIYGVGSIFDRSINCELSLTLSLIDSNLITSKSVIARNLC